MLVFTAIYAQAVTKFLTPETTIPKPMLEIEMQNLPSAIEAPKSQSYNSIITNPTPKNLSPATPHPEEYYPTSHPLQTPYQ